LLSVAALYAKMVTMVLKAYRASSSRSAASAPGRSSHEVVKRAEGSKGVGTPRRVQMGCMLSGVRGGDGEEEEVEVGGVVGFLGWDVAQ
jgi:hypothetical protein